MKYIIYCLLFPWIYNLYLIAMEENQEITFSDEELRRVEGDKLQEALHGTIGCLTFVDQQKKVKTGSALLISYDVILTTADNVYDKDSQCPYYDFKFYLGVDGVADAFYQIDAWRFPDEFKDCPKAARLPYNYAILKLKQPTSIFKYVPLALPCSTCLINDKEKSIDLYGFPCSYQNFNPQQDTKMRLYQYGLSCKDRITIVDYSKFKIGYRVSALAGQSGSPVVVDDTVVGIHVGGENGQLNVGRIIDVPLIKTVRKWIDQLKAYPFQFKDDSSCPHANTLKLQLNLSYKQIQNMDLLDYSNLLELSITQSKLESINPSCCPNLVKINLSQNQLTSADLTSNPNLVELRLYNNTLQSLDLSSNTLLNRIHLDNNKLQRIDLSANTSLEYLNLIENSITEIDLGKNTKLTEVWLHNNKLTSVDLSKNTELVQLGICSNGLSSIDLSNNQKLTHVWLHGNKLTKIDQLGNPLLRELYVQNNCLSQIDLSNNPLLQTLQIAHNNLGEIDLHNNPLLQTLFARFNSLAELDLRKNINLCKLFLESNKLALVRLSILGNVDMDRYTGYQFGYQESAVCRVELECEELAKEKGVEIAEELKRKQSGYQCVKTFAVL